MKQVQLVYTKTCVYCPSAKALFKDLLKKHKFNYQEIDAVSSEGQRLVQKFSIMSVPTIIIDNKVEFIGVPNRDKAEAAVRG